MQPMSIVMPPSADAVGFAASREARPAVNSAGGTGSFAVDDMGRLRRFLILGSEGGTYYASERELGLENAAAVARLIEAGRASEIIAEVLAVSRGGRAPKQSPTLFVLAMVCRLAGATGRKAGFAALPSIARTPTMLFEFLGLSQALGETSGWGRGLRAAVSRVYSSKSAVDVAYAVTKYKAREGWTHRDVLRKAHVKPVSAGHQLVLQYAVSGAVGPLAEEADPGTVEAHKLLSAVEAAKQCTAGPEGEAALLALLREHRLAREHLPTEHLASPAVWAAILPAMPLTAMIRNLGKMTAIGLLKPLSAAVTTVVAKLSDAEALRKARVHPFSVLVALATYKAGRGVRGSLQWEPVPAIVAALDAAFYAAFAAIEPTGKRYVLALDVSGSMGWGGIAGSIITPREAAAAMSMVTMRAEKECHTVAFSHTLVPCPIDPSMCLDEVTSVTDRIPMGGTDCALPMRWAQAAGVEADVFVVYTDNETWYGDVTPAEALRSYRAASGIDAKLIVVGMTASGFSIADPDDSGMLDIVGFDAAAPQIMADFALGRL